LLKLNKYRFFENYIFIDPQGNQGIPESIFKKDYDSIKYDILSIFEKKIDKKLKRIRGILIDAQKMKTNLKKLTR